MPKEKHEVTFEQLKKLNIKDMVAFTKAQPLMFIFACSFLFFEYVRPQQIYTYIAFFPWSAMFAYGTILLTFVNSEKKHPLNLIDGYIIFFSIVVLLSMFFAIDSSLAFEKWDLYFAWIPIYFGIVRSVTTRERFFIFLVLYFLCNFKMTQHGFISWASRGFAFTNWGVTGGPGWFHNSGEFGIQLTIFIPMITAFIIALRLDWGKWTRRFFYLMPFTAIGSVVASSSRGALVGVIASALWGLRISKYFVRTLIGMCVLFAIVWSVIPEESKSRFESSGSDHTSQHRLERWEDGFETMKKYPIFGVGYKNWVPYYLQNYIPEWEGTPLVHNAFIEAGTEMGFTGLFALIMIFFAMFRLNVRVRKLTKGDPDKRYEYMMSNGLDGAMIGLIVSASFVTVLYYPYIWIHAAFVSCFYNTVMMNSESAKK